MDPPSVRFRRLACRPEWQTPPVRADTRSNIAATPAGAAVGADLAAYGQIRSKYAVLMSFNLKSVVKKRIW
jgi:hypothetical protein